MAKVTNPLHSLTASGSIGSALTFTQTGTRSVVKKWAKPTGAPSDAQAFQRSTYQSLMDYWRELDAPTKAAALADRDNTLTMWAMYYPDAFARFAARRPIASRTDWEIWVGFNLLNW